MERMTTMTPAQKRAEEAITSGGADWLVVRWHPHQVIDAVLIAVLDEDEMVEAMMQATHAGPGARPRYEKCAQAVLDLILGSL